LKAQILGTGYALPDHILSNEDLEKIVETSDEWIVTRTGIKERRIADADIATSDLAYEAAKTALDNAKIKAEQLDLIIVATLTPDMPMPATACFLQNRLGATKAAAFDLAAACTGFIYALTVAEQFLLASNYQYILVVGAEILSKVLDFTDRSTCILFGDGAGAMVVGKGKGDNGILASYLGCKGAGASLLSIPAGGTRHPTSQETLSKGMHFMQMQGNEIFKFAVRTIPECASKVLEKASLNIEDVDHIVLHQANLRIIKAAAIKMKVPWEKMLVNIEKYGNVSAASIPICIAEAVEQQKIQSGELVLMVGFGAGLTMGSILVRWGR